MQRNVSIKSMTLLGILAISISMLTSCALWNRWFAPPPPVVVVAQQPSTDAMIASIRAAGAHEKSIIDVTPLSDPGAAVLQRQAHADDQAGRYQDAAAKLDQALKLSPNSPDLLQDRAEIAVRLNDYPLAETLARRSWELGPKLGPLCARNWQTVVEVRLQAGDQAGADRARQSVQQCHRAGINRF